MRKRLRGAAGVLILMLPIMLLTGCTTKTLVFATATKFGLDISQRPDQTIEVTMGYDRVELASIPAQEADAKNDGDDTYSLLGIFSAAYGNPFTGDPLVIRQFFATGWAAVGAAGNPAFQSFFAHKTGEIVEKNKKDMDDARAKQKAQP